MPATAATPGSGVEFELCRTQPMVRSGGNSFAIAPPGSTMSRLCPSSGPLKPWKNHQGTPFMALTITPVRPISGASFGASSGRAWAFRDTIT